MKKLIERIIETKNPTVVGLDPTLSYIPRQIQDEAFAEFGKTLRGAGISRFQQGNHRRGLRYCTRGETTVRLL